MNKKEYKIWLFSKDQKKLKKYARSVKKTMSEVIREWILKIIIK